MRNAVYPSCPVALIVFGLICLLASCAKGPFVPVNEGREYGNPKTPWVVSHLPSANQWALARTGHHHIFQKVLCFNYPCRKMIGRRKTLRAITMHDLKKKIQKNAKKGVYKRYVPVTPAPDTVQVVPDTLVAIVREEPVAIPAPPILKADSLIILSEVLFESNSYRLKREHLSKLDSLGQFLSRHPTLEVRVTGHTDNTGTERHNRTLSVRRAEEVAAYLIAKGANDDRVVFEGMGSTQPIASNDTPEGRSQNRRVEILIRNSR